MRKLLLAIPSEVELKGDNSMLFGSLRGDEDSITSKKHTIK